MRETREGGNGNETLRCCIHRKLIRLQLAVHCPQCQSIHTRVKSKKIKFTQLENKNLSFSSPAGLVFVERNS